MHSAEGFFYKNKNNNFFSVLKVVACMNQIAAFGQVSCTNLITALRYAWTNKSIRVLSLMQYVGMEWTKHWHSSNNDISKELWAYLPNVMVHYLCEDFAAMICHWVRKVVREFFYHVENMFCVPILHMQGTCH